MIVLVNRQMELHRASSRVALSNAASFTFWLKRDNLSTACDSYRRVLMKRKIRMATIRRMRRITMGATMAAVY